jgi:flagellar biosynthesis protein FliP
MLISPGGPSVSRTVTVMTAFFINLEVLILVRASTHGVQNTPALTILAGLLSALIGYVYHRAKSNEERQAHKFPSLKKNIPGF